MSREKELEEALSCACKTIDDLVSHFGLEAEGYALVSLNKAESDVLEYKEVLTKKVSDGER